MGSSLLPACRACLPRWQSGYALLVLPPSLSNWQPRAACCRSVPWVHLQARLPPEELAQVQRLLYGWNAGRPVQALPLPPSAAAEAAAGNFDLQASCCAA